MAKSVHLKKTVKLSPAKRFFYSVCSIFVIACIITTCNSDYYNRQYLNQNANKVAGINAGVSTPELPPIPSAPVHTDKMPLSRITADTNLMAEATEISRKLNESELSEDSIPVAAKSKSAQAANSKSAPRTRIDSITRGLKVSLKENNQAVDKLLLVKSADAAKSVAALAAAKTAAVKTAAALAAAKTATALAAAKTATALAASAGKKTVSAGLVVLKGNLATASKPVTASTFASPAASSATSVSPAATASASRLAALLKRVSVSNHALPGTSLAGTTGSTSGKPVAGTSAKPASAIASASTRQAGIIDGYLKTGDARVRLRDFTGAIVAYTSAIELSPDSSFGYVKRAGVKLSMNDYKGASSDYTTSISLNIDEKTAYHGRAVARLRMNDLNGSLADYNKIIGQVSKGTVKGSISLKSKDYTKALGEYADAIELNPLDKDAYRRSAEAKFYLKDYEGALIDLSKAIHIDPAYTEAYVNRGIVNARMNEHDNAYIDFNRAKSLGEKNADVFIQKYCN